MPAASADPDRLVHGLRDRILAEFPGEIRSLYLLGSRALGSEIEGSDVDFAVLFQGENTPARRQALARWVEGARRPGEPMLEATLLDLGDLDRGLRPHMLIARLLAGEDVFQGRPLKPAETLLGYYVHLALYFIWAVRGRPASLHHPLGYPGDGEFFGYERFGLRVGENEYVPGFAQLVNDVNCLATLCLAKRSEFIPSKSMVAAAYVRCFPGDPRADLVAGVFELGRDRWRGRIPPVAADRERLAGYCRRLLDFENDVMGSCFPLLPRMAASEDSEVRLRARGIVARLSSADPAAAEALAAAKELL
jgi:hypothetical protein